jgi:bifunctional DNase/RNase
MLVEIEFEGFVQTGPDEGFSFLKEREGNRRFAMSFGVLEAMYLRSALRHETHENMLMAHGALLQLLQETAGIELEQVTIPCLEQRGEGDSIFVTECRFRTPAGQITKEFLRSDALAMALYSRCPIFIDEELLEHVSSNQTIEYDPEQLERLTKKDEMN